MKRVANLDLSGEGRVELHMASRRTQPREVIIKYVKWRTGESYRDAPSIAFEITITQNDWDEIKPAMDFLMENEEPARVDS